MADRTKPKEREHYVEVTCINLQSAGSSGRFHDEHEAQAGAALPPWTGSLCERPESPQCWRTKPERENRTNRRWVVIKHILFWVYLPVVFSSHDILILPKTAGGTT